MNVLQDMLVINKEIMPKSLRLTIKNWPIIFTGFVYALIFLLLGRTVFLFSILAGIIITLVQSALFSNYLYLIGNIIQYGKIDLEDFKQGFKVYIWKIYGILFVIWFVNYGAALFLSPLFSIRIGFVPLWSLVQLVAFILLNCLPEVIYQKHYHVGESFRYCFEFIKENWFNWFVPNVILGILLALITGGGLSSGLFFGGDLFSLSVSSLAVYGVAQFLLAFIMVYRGLLFQILSTSSRRKRMFMRNMYR